MIAESTDQITTNLPNYSSVISDLSYVLAGVNQSFIFLFFLFIIVFIIFEFRKKIVLIEPFEVPDNFRAIGINGQTIANKIVDAMNIIKRESRIKSGDSKVVLPWLKDEADLEIPGTSLSIKQIIWHLQKLLGIEPVKIAGEIIHNNNNVQINIRVRGIIEHSLYKSSPEIFYSELNSFCLEIAKLAYMNFEPFRVAAFEYRTSDKNLLNTIKYLTTHGNQKEKSNGYSLLGNVYFDHLNYRYAIRMYRKAINLYSNNFVAYSNLGACLIEKNRLSLAIKVLKYGLIKNLTYSPAYTNLGYALFLQERLVNSERFDIAIDNYRTAIEYDSKNIQAYMNWAFALSELESYDQSINLLKKIIEIEPNNYHAYYNWGLTLETLERFQEARAKFLKVIELDPLGVIGASARNRI